MSRKNSLKDKSLIWEADVYNKSNGAQLRDAQETLDQVVKDNLQNVKIIVDIGCGSGNITAALSETIPHDKIYACDFDPKMVEYANKIHNDGTIEYFVQDIGLPWDKLDERLKNLEGKVDIVWSNRVLHWVKDKETAVNSISRLLRKGGRCYVNTTLERDINEFVSEEERKENSKYVDFETHRQQIDYWKEHFNNCGLSDVHVQMLFKDWIFDNEEQYWGMASYVEPFLRNRIAPGIPDEDKEKVVEMFKVKVYLALQTRYGKPPAEVIVENNQKMYYEQFRILGIK